MSKGHHTTDLIVIEQVNKMLADKFGQTLDGRPLFRISWSSDQLEKKVGWHEEWNPTGTIFIRSWFGCKECLKYAYCMDRWVLERLSFLGDNKIAQMELVDARQGTYEPIYFFMNEDGYALPVNWRVVDFIMSQLQRGKKYTSPTEREDMLEKAHELDDWEVEAYLGEVGRSPLFAFENSVFHDSTKQKSWSR